LAVARATAKPPLRAISAYAETREGTIRAQQAAICRKAGVTGRSDLLARFIEKIAAGLRRPARP